MLEPLSMIQYVNATLARCCLIYPFSKQNITCKIACPSTVFKYCHSSWVNTYGVFNGAVYWRGSLVSQWNSNLKIFLLIIHISIAKQYCSSAADQCCFTHFNQCWNTVRHSWTAESDNSVLIKTGHADVCLGNDLSRKAMWKMLLLFAST